MSVNYPKPQRDDSESPSSHLSDNNVFDPYDTTMYGEPIPQLPTRPLFLTPSTPRLYTRCPTTSGGRGVGANMLLYNTEPDLADTSALRTNIYDHPPQESTHMGTPYISGHPRHVSPTSAAIAENQRRQQQNNPLLYPYHPNSTQQHHYRHHQHIRPTITDEATLHAALQEMVEHRRKLKAFIQTPVTPTRTSAIQRAYEIFNHLDPKREGLWGFEELHLALSMVAPSKHEMSQKKHNTSDADGNNNNNNDDDDNKDKNNTTINNNNNNTQDFPPTSAERHNTSITKIMSHDETDDADLLDPYSHSLFSQDEVRTILHIASSHGDGYLRFSDFYSIFAVLTLLRNKFAVDTTYLTHNQLRQALHDSGLDVSPTHLAQMLKVHIPGVDPQHEHHLTMENHPTMSAPPTLTPSHSMESTELNYVKKQKFDEKGEPIHTIDFPQLLSIYTHSPRSEGDLLLFSWYKAGRTSSLLEHENVDATPLEDFIAGTAAGIALTLVGHQFDTIKIRMQTGGFSNAIDCVKETIRKESVLALYKGMSGPMLTIPLINAIVFACYGQAQTLLQKYYPQKDGEPLPLWQIALAGMYAGLINCVVASPVELIKTHLQIQYDNTQLQYRGPIGCVKQILHKEGIKGLFRGMAATVLRELPGYGAQFYCYEGLKRYCMTLGDRSEYELTAPELMMSGGMAGIMGWVFSYPMDFVKSQLQSQPFGKPSPWKKHPFLFDGGFIDCWKTTVRKHGHRELWKGFSVCLARGFPANAAGFLAYEHTLGFFKRSGVLRTKQEQPMI